MASAVDETFGWDEAWEQPAREGRFVDAVTEYVRAYDYVTFPELQRRLSAFMPTEGTVSIVTPLDPNIITWAGMSREFADVMVEALATHRIYPHPSSWLTHLVDGGLLRLPIVRRLTPGGRKKEGWLPTCLRVVPMQDKPKRKRPTAAPAGRGEGM